MSNNLIVWIQDNKGLVGSVILHGSILLAVIFWASRMIEPVSLSTEITPGLQAEVLNESLSPPAKPIQKPIEQSVVQKPIEKPVPIKDTIPVIHEKPKPKPIPKLQPKPKPKPKPVLQQKIIQKTEPQKTQPPKVLPKKITPQEIKALQQETIASMKNAILQNQMAAQNQAKYLTERDQYIALLSQVIRTRWINQYQDQSLQVSLKIEQDSKGNVMGVSVTDSSGNDAFDRSAIMAVQKSSPLPLPPDPILLGDTRQMTLAFS